MGQRGGARAFCDTFGLRSLHEPETKPARQSAAWKPACTCEDKRTRGFKASCSDDLKCFLHQRKKFYFYIKNSFFSLFCCESNKIFLSAADKSGLAELLLVSLASC